MTKTRTKGHPEQKHSLADQRRHPEPVEGRRSRPATHFTSPAAAVERARNMLDIERTLDQVSDSLFDAIVANEVGPATSLAIRMLGDYPTATAVVHSAFERARSEFSSYDGSDSPRSWIFGYVAEEAVNRSTQDFGRASSPGCEDATQSDTESALHCLKPERRLAVILTDVLGMTDEAAAKICRVDLTTIRQQAATARSWIARHLSMPERHAPGTDGAMG